MTKKTGAERYFDTQMRDPEFRKHYDRARQRVDAIDELVRALANRCEELELSSSQIEMLTGKKSSLIRRLFTSQQPNPTISTILELANMLDLELSLIPKKPAGTTRKRIAKQLADA